MFIPGIGQYHAWDILCNSKDIRRTWSHLFWPCLNSLGPSEVKWRHISGSTFAQVMACCPMAPSHDITKTNIDLSSEVFCDIHFGTILHELLMNLIYNICSCSEIALLILLPHLPGAMSQPMRTCIWQHPMNLELFTIVNQVCRCANITSLGCAKFFRTCGNIQMHICAIDLESYSQVSCSIIHDDVIKWKHFPRYWPVVRGIHRPPVNSPHKGQWRGALMFSLICAQINGWANNREAGNLRPHRTHYDVILMHSVNLRSSLSNRLIKFVIVPV